MHSNKIFVVRKAIVCSI